MGIIKNFNTNTKLKTRFIIYFSCFALLPIILMGIIIYNSAHSVNLKDAKENLRLEANLVKEGYDSNMKAYASMLDYLSGDARYSGYLSGDVESGADAMTRLNAAFKSLNAVSFLYVTDVAGKVVLDSDFGSMVGNDYSDREYYTRVRQTGQTTLSLARTDQKSGNPAVIYMEPIKAAGERVVGYMGIVVDLTALSADIIDKAKILETGFVAAFETSTMHCIMTTQKENMLSDYATKIPGFTEALRDTNVSSFEYVSNGDKRLASFAVDTNLGWTYTCTVELAEVTEVSRSILITVLILSLVLLAAAPTLAVFISGSIIRPINQVSEAMGNMAEGNLTIALNMEGKDAVMVMGQSLDSAVSSLNESVTGVKMVASEVQGYSNNLALTMEQMSTATSEVASAIQDVAKGATNQAADLTEIVSMLNIFASDMDAIGVSAGSVAESSFQAEGKAVEGKEQVGELSSSITSIGKSFGVFMETISNLGHSVDKIGDITDAINAISDQTNLLALNAAIEAARAGEQGKGFAVVADEVRNLAAESKKSSEEIMELIRRVSQETQGVIKASEEVNGLLSNQEKVIGKTVESFQMITEAIHQITPQVTEAKSAMARAVKAKDGVVSHVEGVAAVSEEVSASAEEIAASSEELLSSIEEVSGVSGKMNKSVHTLTEQVRIYKTE